MVEMVFLQKKALLTKTCVLVRSALLDRNKRRSS